MDDRPGKSVGPGAAVAARTIYAGIISSTAIVSIGAYAVRRSFGILPGTGPLDFVALFAGVGAILLVLVLRARLPARSGASDDDWWKANAGRAITVWALLEAPAILARDLSPSGPGPTLPRPRLPGEFVVRPHRWWLPIYRYGAR